jgi:hypothetical protein
MRIGLKLSKSHREFICPNCKAALKLASFNGNFKNPLFEIFKTEIIHSASDIFRFRFKNQCSACEFPVNISTGSNSKILKVSFPYDWLIIGNDPSKWVKWKNKQLNSYSAGLLDPPASYSTKSNIVGARFREFISTNLDSYNLRVLDVGCGILKRPIYLKDFKKEFIFGIDPFDTMFDGNIVNCSSENLPFQAGFFNLIIASSTVDHFLDWQESFLEIDRVLKIGGNLAIYQHLSNSLEIGRAHV